MDVLIGNRFVCNGYFGTVLYKGILPTLKGEWLGVEWDDPSRGKHDGTLEGTRYFITRHPTSGSFLRLQKADFGITYSEAVQQRYGCPGKESIDESEMYIMGINNVVKPVEVFGLDDLSKKQSQFNELEQIFLHNMRIKGVGSEDDLSHYTSNVQELDLSKNLLISWNEIAKITVHLKHLKVLNVSENRLSVPDDPSTLSSAFSSLERILMNKLNYTWDQILTCSEMWPSISILHVPFNNISILKEPGLNVLCNLEFLDLESNHLTEWKYVLELGFLPRLQKLNLNNTGISAIYFPVEDLSQMKTKLFPELKCLYLNDNNCDKWLYVAELNKLQHLNEVSMRNNPFLESEKPETARQFFIAKIEKLKMLNRTEVLPDERKGAELDYLKRYGQAWFDSGGSLSEEIMSMEFVKEHPTYLALIKKHGAPEKDEMKVQSTNLKSKLISIEIINPEDPNIIPVTKKLPMTMTIQKIKSLIQRLFKVDSEDLTISLISNKDKINSYEIPLDNDQRQLSFYSAEDGNSILARW